MHRVWEKAQSYRAELLPGCESTRKDGLIGCISHLFLCTVISECETGFDHGGAFVEDQTKVVGSMRSHVRLHVLIEMTMVAQERSQHYSVGVSYHCGKILQDSLLEFLFLLAGVGVVKAEQELTVVALRIRHTRTDQHKRMLIAPWHTWRS